MDQQLVTPWEVKGATVDGVARPIDFDKLIRQFGVQRLEPADIERFERVTGHRAHHLIRRGAFFAHRDLHAILDLHEQGKPFYLYTGRGPSHSSMHLGHAIPFMFCKYLQDVFRVPLVIQLTDDEKFMFKDDLSLEQCRSYAYTNAREIIAFGFDPDRTFIFLDSEYYGHMFGCVLRVQKCLNFNQSSSVFGFDESCSIGKIAYPCAEIATCFSAAFPHLFDAGQPIPSLIPCAIDQDPYFRLARDIAPRLGYKKPSILYCSFFPALQGFHSKMSSSVDFSAIFMSDSVKVVRDKIRKYAFSGGQADVETHRRLGGDPEVDVAFQYLRCMLEDDDELARIECEYRSGRMLTGELKDRCIEVLGGVVTRFQQARDAVDADLMARFMRLPPINWSLPPCV